MGARRQAAKLMKTERRILTEEQDSRDMATLPWYAQRNMRNLLTVVGRNAAAKKRETGADQ